MKPIQEIKLVGQGGGGTHLGFCTSVELAERICRLFGAEGQATEIIEIGAWESITDVPGEILQKIATGQARELREILGELSAQQRQDILNIVAPKNLEMEDDIPF
ncbi:MAG TPA: hypothetical protein VMV50_03470 [Candidatus Paceibacterota bacterium]|nr:hypothetical protein [Candidatus Paceibacterota bacterium]